MCNDQYSESGARIGHDPCSDYLALKSDRDRLAGQNKGLSDGNAILKKTLDAMEMQQESLIAENEKYRAALAPILAHADAHDCAPPLKFSVDACREIREKVKS